MRSQVVQHDGGLSLSDVEARERVELLGVEGSTGHGSLIPNVVPTALLRL